MKLNKNLSLLGIIFFIVILTFSISYKIHYTTDSWCIMKMGVDEYSKVTLGNGRIVEYCILQIFCRFNLEFIVLYRIFLTITALIISTSIYVTYKFFDKKGENDKFGNLILLLSSFNIFLTISLAEMCIFIECLTMSLSILLSIIASILYTKNKYIISFILLFIATLSYQASITLFPIYILIKYFINNNEKKYDFKYIFKILFFYFFNLLICFAILKIVKMIGINITDRVGKFGIIYIIKNVIINFGTILFLFIIKILWLKNITKENYIEILIIIFMIVITTCTLTFGTNSILSYRMMCSIYGCLGICGIYAYLKFDLKTNTRSLIIIESIILLLNIASFVLYINLNIIQTKQTQYIFEKCQYIIKEYEEENNKEIKNILFYIDKEINCIFANITTCWPPYLAVWSQEEFFELIIGREINSIEYDEEIYNKYFKENNWKEFSEELLVFKDNTLHFCIY